MGQILGPIGYLFNIIFTYPIFNLLMVLDRIIGDFGLAIVVLTLIVKLVLFPLTLKQLKSMKATQALQPQIAEIKKKYAKDQRAQMEATQALYKEYGMNPVAGSCLPLLIQMPVLFGLFYALSAVLRSAHNVNDINKLLYPFIPPFHTMPSLESIFIYPIFGHISLGAPDPTHILPILAALATFMQLRMSQPKPLPGATPDPTQQQMKIMQYISPLMVGFFGWNYAAGLALYWTVSSVFAIFQQYFVTGWGSLLVVPNMLSKNSNNNAGSSKSYTGDRAKEKKMQAKADEVEKATVVESGPVGSQLQTSSHSNGSSPARRRSASARRRSSNNIPKRNASRS
ncbi:MAG TPA: YidC/Oxa1 family membrane protein insertase [Ktedonobacteraceae bacterium]|nr:YidC/Oxa1 family membrane protein insertase [Ktedonobacteraceae bacterium]